MLKNLAIIAILIHAQLINTGPKRKVFTTPTCTPSTAGVVQSAVGITSGFPSTPFTSPNTAGNTIVVWYAMVVYAGTPTPTDTQGNSYVNKVPICCGGIGTGFYVATGIKAGANTVNFNTYGSDAIIIIAEISGSTGIETSTATNGDAATPIPVGPITTTSANTLVLFGAAGDSSLIPTDGSSWATINSKSTGLGSALYSCVANIPGNYSNTVTAVGFQSGAALMGLKM